MPSPLSFPEFVIRSPFSLGALAPLAIVLQGALGCTDKTVPPPGPELAASSDASGSDDSGPVTLPPEDADAIPASAFADEKAVAKPVTTLEQWKKLPADVRQDLVDTSYGKQPAMVKTDPVLIAGVTDSAQKAFADKMLKFMQSNSDLNVDDPGHGLVGPLETKVATLSLKDGTLLGGEIFFNQIGCDTSDEKTPHFKGKADAEAAGCTTGTVTWTGHGTFNFDMTPFEYSDFLEAAF